MATSVPTPPNDVAVAVYELPSDDADAPARPDSRDIGAQRDRALLRQNASWFCRLRWFVVALMTLAGIAAFFPDLALQSGLRLTPAWLFSCVAILTLANGIYLDLLRRLPPEASARTLRVLLWSQIVVDLLVLTAVIHFLGSRDTFAPFAYLFHIILACIFFHRQESLAVTIVSATLYGGLLLLENTRFLTQQTAFVDVSSSLGGAWDHALWNWQFVSLLAIWGIIWYLASRLANELRDRECELATTNLRLEASSLERARHMLQTTHQLKAPFAAIHANTQLLLGGYSGALSEPSKRLVQRIAARSLMLSQQIQEMLQLANLRSQAQSQHTVAVIELQ